MLVLLLVVVAVTVVVVVMVVVSSFVLSISLSPSVFIPRIYFMVNLERSNLSSVFCFFFFLFLFLSLIYCLSVYRCVLISSIHRLILHMFPLFYFHLFAHVSLFTSFPYFPSLLANHSIYIFFLNRVFFVASFSASLLLWSPLFINYVAHASLLSPVASLSFLSTHYQPPSRPINTKIIAIYQSVSSSLRLYLSLASSLS